MVACEVPFDSVGPRVCSASNAGVSSEGVSAPFAPCECCGLNSSLQSSACGYDLSWHSCGCGDCDMDNAFHEPARHAQSGALASIVCSTIALLIMLIFPRMRQHPNNYLALKCVADVIFCAVQLCHWRNLGPGDELFSSTSSPPVPSYRALQSTAQSKVNPIYGMSSITQQRLEDILHHGFTWHGCSRTMACLTQFAAMVSILCFGMIPCDTYVLMNYPFLKMKEHGQRCIMIITVISAIATIVLYSSDFYGTGYSLCWVCCDSSLVLQQAENENTLDNVFAGGAQSFHIGLSYLWVALVAVANVVFMLLIGNRLCVRGSSSDTSSDNCRRGLFVKCLGYSMTYCIYYLLILIHYWRVYHVVHNPSYWLNGTGNLAPANKESFYRQASDFVWVTSLIGVSNLFLLLCGFLFRNCQWHTANDILSGAERSHESLGRHERMYAGVLRAEIVNYLGQGIEWSVNRTRKLLGPRSLQSQVHQSSRTLSLRSNGSFALAQVHVDINALDAIVSGHESDRDADARDSQSDTDSDSPRKSVAMEDRMSVASVHTDAVTSIRGNRSRVSIVSRASDTMAQSDDAVWNSVRSKANSFALRTSKLNNMAASALQAPLLERSSSDSSWSESEERERSFFNTMRQHSNTSHGYQASVTAHSHNRRTGSTTVKSNFIFTDYAPGLFWRARDVSGVDHDEYMHAVSKAPIERLSEGASGALMYYSPCNRFIVKTHTHTEIQSLMDMIDEYVSHIEQHKNSLLVRFLGAYTIQIYRQKIHFIVMKNVFEQCDGDIEIYDLKGSFVNRNSKHSTQLKGETMRCSRCKQQFVMGDLRRTCPEAEHKPHIPRIVLKDNDFHQKVRLPSHLRMNVMRQLRLDARFLEAQGLMDYSLLVGVQMESVPHSHAPTSRGPPSMQSLNGPLFASEVEGHGAYYMGIVDILQKWTIQKRLERFAKVNILCNCKFANGLSAINPTSYRRRFERRVIHGSLKQRGDRHDDWLLEDDESYSQSLHSNFVFSMSSSIAYQLGGSGVGHRLTGSAQFHPACPEGSIQKSTSHRAEI